ncbi:MAG: helix-turn-helix domain-containing protein [Bdellovibrionales bacterium]|nr:helix-turn-helix domain-containing protein [Bdellovibrionales bacterium]
MNSKRTADEERWLKALGANIAKLIKEKGYKTPYDFWLKAGDQLSRTTLSYILKGKVDVKATNLRKIAKALKVSPKDLLSF